MIRLAKDWNRTAWTGYDVQRKRWAGLRKGFAMIGKAKERQRNAREEPGKGMAWIDKAKAWNRYVKQRNGTELPRQAKAKNKIYI